MGVETPGHQRTNPSIKDKEEPDTSGNCSREPVRLGWAQAGTEGRAGSAARVGIKLGCMAPSPVLRPRFESRLQLPGCTAPRSPPCTLPTPPPSLCLTCWARAQRTEHSNVGAGRELGGRGGAAASSQAARILLRTGGRPDRAPRVSQHPFRTFFHPPCSALPAQLSLGPALLGALVP